MGGCLSVASSSFRPSAIEAVESTLDTGDIVWLAGKGPSKFMFKAAGTWKMFSRVGVLVRNGPGLEGLQLCVPQACVAEPTAAGTPSQTDEYVTIGQLSDELSSGMYKQVAVTKLATPLSEPERAFVFSFCNSSIGQLMNHKAQLCVNPSRRVFCNQLAAEMLVSCGRVALVDSIYGPAKQVAGSLLQPPLFLNVAAAKGAAGGRWLQSDTTFVADKDSKVFRDVNDQHEVFYSVHSLPSADDPGASTDVALRRSGDNMLAPSGIGGCPPVTLNTKHSPGGPTKLSVGTGAPQHAAVGISV